MHFQCVLILALSLVQNEAADRFSYSLRSGPDRAFRSVSPKHIQGSFETAAELAKLIQKVKNEAGDERGRLQFQHIEDPSTTDDETHLQGIFNNIQKKIDNEGIRIHVLKDADVLERYKKDMGSRALFIDNPEVLEKYVKELKFQKTDDTKDLADFGNLLLKRRNAVFRLEEPDASRENKQSYRSDLPKDANQNYEARSRDVKPINHQNIKYQRKRYEGGISEEISKRFNKVTNKNKGGEQELSSGKKSRDSKDRSREVRKEVRENRVYKNDRENSGNKNARESLGNKNARENLGNKNARENRGYKDARENRGSNKREFKDYPEFKSPDNPNLASSKTKKNVDFDYDKPRKQKKSAPRDYDYGLESKKRNKDKFEDYGQDKKKGDGWGQSMGSEPKRQPVAKMDWDDKPKRNFEKNERRRPRKEGGWAPSIRGGSDDYNARSSKNEGYGFGNTPIPFNRPRNIYVNDNGD